MHKIQKSDWLPETTLLFVHLLNFMAVRMVKLKLPFIAFYCLLSFHNLVILIKSYEIRNLNFDKALFFPRNQAICLKN